MRTRSKLTALAAGIALGIAPAAAVAAGHGDPHGRPLAATHTTEPRATPKAYGKYCQTESKTHVEGEKGTPFSDCVVDMAQLAKADTTNPRKACENETKTHAKGEKGTAFSRCVSAAKRLLEAEARSGDHLK